MPGTPASDRFLSGKWLQFHASSFFVSALTGLPADGDSRLHAAMAPCWVLEVL